MSEQLDKPSNSSPALSRRDSIVIVLIQKSRRRAELPMIAALDERGALHPEMTFELSVWTEEIATIPEAYLVPAYERALTLIASDRPFIPGLMRQAFADLRREEKLALEDRRRRAIEPDCWHCADQGYQPLYAYEEKSRRWYRALRPCACAAAPEGQRKATPLQSPGYRRSGLGEYVSERDYLKYGAPATGFEG